MTKETPEPTLTLEELQQFFEERQPVLTVSPIGEEAGLAYGYLNKVLKGERGLSKTTVTKLLPVLHKYGYKMPQPSTPTTLTLEQFHFFLKEHKACINLTALAKEIGITIGHLNKVIAREKSFTQKTADKLLEVLPKYGYRG